MMTLQLKLKTEFKKNMFDLENLGKVSFPRKVINLWSKSLCQFVFEKRY